MLGVEEGVGGVWNRGGIGIDGVGGSGVMDEVEGAVKFLSMRRSSS
jgi:hypothetical protein